MSRSKTLLSRGGGAEGGNDTATVALFEGATECGPEGGRGGVLLWLWIRVGGGGSTLSCGGTVPRCGCTAAGADTDRGLANKGCRHLVLSHGLQLHRTSSIELEKLGNDVHLASTVQLLVHLASTSDRVGYR